jgi:pimeloyl-ACP methyl ester carboxylesterase
MAEGVSAGWLALEDALAAGDLERVRRALRDLDGAGQEILAERIGARQTAQLVRGAQRGRAARGTLQGRVVVIHGIIGACLDVCDRRKKCVRVWVSKWHLFNGRIADLALADGTHPRDPGIEVRVAGLFPEYLPLIMKLKERWEVEPFAFDWRLNMDDSATKLAETIGRFAQGGPCHIVAHSMGGLVSRRMAALYPEVWDSMQDPQGNRRGGRLIQLGTPNRGSFAVPMLLTGQESLVRKLALLDSRHRLEELLPILASFPGSYQMLPAPGSAPDDRDDLYRVEKWGGAPAVGEYLKLGREFQEGLAAVKDPGRIVYVAGFDQDTPYRVKIQKPGVFQYKFTRRGDGRVPHELGLLEGVKTLWVDEVHGDLPRNESVLAGMDELLLAGTTPELLQTLPATRGVAPKGWIDHLPEPPSERELRKLRGASRKASGRRRAEPPPGDPARLEALVLRGFVGDSPDAPGAAAPAVPSAPRPRSPSKPLTLKVEVVCGDIRKVKGDVYAVGHYAGVAPQFAEAALDEAVSGKNVPRERRVLRSSTRRGVLRGELGAVNLYPWADGSGRLVAVAGMGRPGSFGRSELRRLGQSLTAALLSLPRIKTVCSVLIGSGAGNLPVREAVEGLLSGAADALRDERKGARSLTQMKLVDRDLIKAQEIQASLKQVKEDGTLAGVLKLELRRRVKVHPSARSQEGYSLSLSLAGLAEGAEAASGRGLHGAVKAFVRSLPGSSSERKKILENLEKLKTRARAPEGIENLASHLEVVVHDPEREAGLKEEGVPTRFSCMRDADQLRFAALSNTAVVPVRSLRFDLALFAELAVDATDPPAERAAKLGAFVGRLLIPHDFAPHLRRAEALVAELDRYTAGLSWELMSLGEPGEGATDIRALSLSVPFARQLLTAYSPAPLPPPPDPARIRVLVIGDPGDPREGLNLPGARREAIEVTRFLRQQPGVDVEARIGAPSAPLQQDERWEAEPAGRLEVLELVLSERFDLVHYCGHGDFDPRHPDQVGWVFEGGLLTAREIERMEQAPRLIVANACLSGRLAEGGAGGGNVGRRRDDSGLLPTLADEFFKRGVRDYVGTAWEVDDEGATEFAKTLYEKLLSGAGTTLGEAIRAAREELYRHTDRYDALWAAYQHYGDPTTRLRPAGEPEP